MQFAGTVVARKDLGEYWKSVMDSQPMPDAIQGRIHPETRKEVHFVKDFVVDYMSSPFFYTYFQKTRPEKTITQDLIHPEARKEDHLSFRF